MNHAREISVALEEDAKERVKEGLDEEEEGECMEWMP